MLTSKEGTDQHAHVIDKALRPSECTMCWRIADTVEGFASEICSTVGLVARGDPLAGNDFWEPLRVLGTTFCGAKLRIHVVHR
jgi:hypothetical protein